MSPDKITRMANQIATFFETQPDADRAGRVADHLREFWEPRMLDHLAQHVQNGGRQPPFLWRPQGAPPLAAGVAIPALQPLISVKIPRFGDDFDMTRVSPPPGWHRFVDLIRMGHRRGHPFGR